MEDMSKAKMECECGSFARPTTLKVEGFKVRGWRCPKCGMEYLHPEDSEKIYLLNKLKNQEITVKIGIIGRAEFIRIPRDVVEVMNLKKGEEISIKLKSPEELVLTSK